MEFSVNVRILGDEKRFGFSVMGGTDEGFPPRIDEISPGIVLQSLFTKVLRRQLGRGVILSDWESGSLGFKHHSDL